MPVVRDSGVVEARMEFRLLGPLEVVAEGRRVSLGGSRARALLALLLLHRNEVVPLDRIVDELWDERPPKTAEQVVRVYVSQLRKALEPTRSNGHPQLLVTRDSGYLVVTDSEHVDVDRFDALRATGRRLLAEGEHARAANAFAEALALWRGPPLQEFAYEGFARSEIARLEELRLTTLEDRFDAELATGRDSELVADLRRLVEANPLRERMRGQLMVALYRSGRQAEALDTYRQGRHLLVAELGLEPSEMLRRLETRILQRDTALDSPRGSRPPAATGTRRPRAGRRAPVAGATVVLAAAAAAGLLTVGVAGHRGRPSAVSSRVSLVVSGPSDPSATPAGVLDQIDALRAAALDAGLRARVRYGGPTEGDFLRTIATAARTSGLVIVGATPDVRQISDLTRRFPHTRFLVPDTVSDTAASFAGQANVTGVNFYDYENAYLGGYLSALMTRGRQKVSAVGGIATLSVRNLVAGFAAGARRARPDIRVLVDYTGTFLPQAQTRCEKAANRQIDRGSRVVFDVAGGCGLGALSAAGLRDVWGLGVDDDLSGVGPQVLASVVKRFDLATQRAVELFASGRLPRGQDLQLGLASGTIGLVGISHLVPPAIRGKVEALDTTLRTRDEARRATRP